MLAGENFVDQGLDKSVGEIKIDFNASGIIPAGYFGLQKLRELANPEKLQEYPINGLFDPPKVFEEIPARAGSRSHSKEHAVLRLAK